ncbi:hypothetical protein [Scleromatobacter humisilvae]|uniref:Uncharacterized protein n=1 Tax=Scleromatobacter humisilvae TaxID=2897159 RepID=A0A9X1YJJ8_9BURK|nr:hypothetical protein [Scleromatobacter humisilvae]MCK9686050.1 hypothetical protein [Scleromatobacter humisilvae]
MTTSHTLATLAAVSQRFFGLAVLSGAVLCAAPAFAADMHVIVDNESPTAIVEIHASPTYDDDPGVDVLGDEIIYSGDDLDVNFNSRSARGECILDVLAIGADGREWQRRMNVCRQVEWTLGY